MSDPAIVTPEQTSTSHWEVVPLGWFSLQWELLLHGETVATLKTKLMRESCEFEIGGYPFEIRRKPVFKDGFQLTSGDQVVCDVRRKFWSQRYTIAVAGEDWQLRPATWISRTRELWDGSCRLGTIKPAGWFSRRYLAEFRSEVPPPIQLLTIFLVLITDRRAAQSAGG